MNVNKTNPPPPTSTDGGSDRRTLFPSIDLREGKVVRLTQGDYERQTTYGDDPVAQARAFADAGASWVHIVDLDGARDGRLTHLSAIERVCRDGGLKVEASGGLRSEQTIDQLFSVGVERVCLGTAALANREWFEDLVHMPAYSGRVALGLDAREGRLAVSGWTEQLKATALEVAKRVSGWPLPAIVYTDIAADGTMTGPNIDGVRQIAAATGVPVVASGGVGSLDHLRALRALPIAGAIVGRAIYEGAFTVEEAVRVFEGGSGIRV